MLSALLPRQHFEGGIRRFGFRRFGAVGPALFFETLGG